MIRFSEQEAAYRKSLWQQGYWEIPDGIDTTGFDFDWRPSPYDRPYVHQFGTQWQKTGGPRFVIPEAEGTKYQNHQRAKKLPEPEKFQVVVPCSVDFDWSWHPDDTEPPFIWTFGNQHLSGQEMPTVEYHVPGATQRKFENDITAWVIGDQQCWHVLHDIDRERFNFKWSPHPWDPPFIYVWGNQLLGPAAMPTVEYHVPGATEHKYMTDDIAILTTDPSGWRVHHEILPTSFDFSWVPHPHEPPFIYVWGNQHLGPEKMPTVEYHMPGATDHKYMTDQTPHLANDPNAWILRHKIIDGSFDFDWTPHPWDPPFIYVWGNQWYDATIMPTVEYHVPGATERKFMTDRVPQLPSTEKNWHVLVPGATRDFSWVPPPQDPAYIYVWGNQWNAAEVEPTIEYHVPGATERKYMHDVSVSLPSTRENWRVIIPGASIDFSWRPNPHDPPYIYVWGHKWNPVEIDPAVEYHAPGATDRKYMTDQVAVLSKEHDRWQVLIPGAKFDFSWRPDPREPAFIYVWGNQWHDAVKEPTIEYHMPGATERKYMHDRVATVPATRRNWRIITPGATLDFSWRPDPDSPPYIYVWGNQWNPVELDPAIEYRVPGATEYKFMYDQIVQFTAISPNWVVNIPGATLDFSWRPPPVDPPLIYVWGNQWNAAEVEPTVEYRVPGATECKYMKNAVAIVPPDMENWQVPEASDLETFDFSWRPNPHSPAQIYQWENNGPTYTVPGATEVVLMKRLDVNNTDRVPRYFVRTTLEDLIAEHPDEVFWACREHLDYTNFNFGWKPDESNFRHINVFGNKLSRETQTYYVNAPMYQLGYRFLNYVDTFELNENQDLKITQFIKLDMFWVDMSNVGGAALYEGFRQRFPDVARTRFINSWRDTILRCVKKARTKYIWVLNSRTDYSNFEFDWYPAEWQQNMVHVFGSQWNHWGNTYLINTETFERDTEYIPVIEHLKNINHVKTKAIPVTGCNHDMVFIDMGNTDSQSRLEYYRSLTHNVYSVAYQGSYLQTIKRLVQDYPVLASKRDYHVWIVNSIADYSNFDWSWYPDPFQRDQIHVFASEYRNTRQKFGDTLFVNLAALIAELDNLVDLESYKHKVNYISYLFATRMPHPVIMHEHDSQADAIGAIEPDKWPYYELIADTDQDQHRQTIVPSVWGQNHEKILVGSTSAGHIMVPNSALRLVRDEVYDFPQIDRMPRLTPSRPLDVVFISNGEPAAAENYQYLEMVLRKHGQGNRLIWINQVNGRVESQHAAAYAAETPWYFLVNGKLKINEKFDWGWQPDRLQQAKHYIFTATNPVNGLEYGHQAIVANNRELTLQTVAQGLDFTLDSLHTVVNANSGVAVYNTDPWTTWRTAFRESIKLRNNTDAISAERLQAWLSPGTGAHAEWSQRGAQAGVAYWESVDGDLDKLMLSYDWAWIKQYYNKQYGN